MAGAIRRTEATLRSWAGRDRSGAALLPGLVVLALLAGTDAIFSPHAVLVGSFLLAPLLAGAIGRARETAVVGAAALAVAAASAGWHHDFGDGPYVIRLVVIAAGGAVATTGAAVRARAHSELDRMELLAAVAEVANGTLSLAQTTEQVLDLLVPKLADVAAIEGPRGESIGRLGVRVADSPGREDIERALKRSGGTSSRLAGTEESRLIPSVSDTDLRALAREEEDIPHLRALALKSALVIPLRARGRSLGTLICAVGASGRSYATDEKRFAEVLSGRIALALDNAGLSASLSSLELQMAATLENLAEAVTVQDAVGQTIFANPAAVELLRLRSAEQAVSAAPGEMASWFDVFAEDGRPVALEDFPGARVRAGEDAGELLVRNIVRATGEERWLINKATPVFDDRGVLSLVVNVIEDVTQVKRAELRQRVLAQAGAALSSSLEYEGTLREVAQLAVPGLADWCGVNMPDRYGLLRQVAVAVSDPDKAVIADRYGERYPGRMSDPGGAAEVIRSGQPQMVTDIPDALLVEAAQNDEHLAMLRELGMRAVIVVPLTSAGRTIGALSLVMAESGRTFDDDDMDLARELGRRAALAVENARLYSERSEIAATLQRSLLPPDLPDMPGWTAATLYRAAGEQNEVGGDFYDAFAVPGGWMVLVGDVAGRGAEAAALTSLARYTLRTAGQILGDPVAAFERLNVTLRERPDLSMVSVCCVVLRDEAPGALAEVVCAGHPPLYHLDGQGTPRPVGNHAPFLGAFDDSQWSSSEVELSGADQLVLYTDGVLDTVGETERFGERRLSNALAGAPGPGEVVRRIDDALTAFAAGEQQQDDTAVLVVRREA